MKRIFLSLATVLSLTAIAAAQPANPMSQSMDNTTIAPGNTIACATTMAPQLTSENSFIRAYTPMNEGINFAIDVTCIRFAVEIATGGAGATPPMTQPLEIRLYIDTGNVFPGMLPGPPVWTEMFNLPDQAMSAIVTQGITSPTPVTVQPTDVLVVEVYSANGIPAGNLYFHGSNGNGETAPSYFLSVPCGVATPTPYAMVGTGFPNVHLIIDVGWTPQGVVPTPTLTLTGVPNPGMVGVTDLTVAYTNLLPGREIYTLYSFTPCVGGPGTGPIVGLCITVPELLGQLNTPLGVAPLHFTSQTCDPSFGPFALPSGLNLEARGFDVTGGTLNAMSNTVFISL